MGAYCFWQSIFWLRLCGAIDGMDIKTMKEMTKELGPFSGLLQKPIDLMGKLTRSKD